MLTLRDAALLVRMDAVVAKAREAEDFAVAQLQKNSNGSEMRDSKAVRAARVYLRALSSFIGQA